MLPPLAQLDALNARTPGGIDDDDNERASAALSDASALVRATAKHTWVDADEALIAVPDVVVSITLAVALRAFVNPADGVTQEVVASDYTAAYSSGGLYLTNLERQTLQQLRPTSGLWTLGTTRSDEPEPLYFGGLPVGALHDSLPREPS